MGYSVFPAPSAASKTMKRELLISGTTYTVPAGVDFLNVTTIGGGGAGSGIKRNSYGGSYGSAGGNTTFTGATTANGGSAAGPGHAGGAQGPNGQLFGQGGKEATGVDGQFRQSQGGDGQIRHSIVNVTAGQQISYSIGAGGSGSSSSNNDADGGNGANGAIIIEYWS